MAKRAQPQKPAINSKQLPVKCPKNNTVYGSLRFCCSFDLAPRVLNNHTTSTSSTAAVTAVGFKLIGAISNLQSEAEVEFVGCLRKKLHPYLLQFGRKITVHEKSDNEGIAW